MVTRALLPEFVHVTLIVPAFAQAEQLPPTMGYVTGAVLEAANELTKPAEEQFRQDAAPALLLRAYTAPTQHKLVTIVLARLVLAQLPVPLVTVVEIR